MIAYTVLWSETATNQLVEIWLKATDRAEVNDSVRAIDAVLSGDPLHESTRDLAEGLRKLIVLPLCVVYSIENQDRIVEVAAVRRVVLSPP